MKPIKGKVVIAPFEPKEVSEGGVVLPKEAQRPQLIGVVVAVGIEVPQEGDSAIRVGDTVIYPQYAGTEIRLRTEDKEDIILLVMEWTNLIGIAEVE